MKPSKLKTAAQYIFAAVLLIGLVIAAAATLIFTFASEESKGAYTYAMVFVFVAMLACIVIQFITDKE